MLALSLCPNRPCYQSSGHPNSCRAQALKSLESRDRSNDLSMAIPEICNLFVHFLRVAFARKHSFCTSLRAAIFDLSPGLLQILLQNSRMPHPYFFGEARFRLLTPGRPSF